MPPWSQPLQSTARLRWHGLSGTLVVTEPDATAAVGQADDGALIALAAAAGTEMLFSLLKQLLQPDVVHGVVLMPTHSGHDPSSVKGASDVADRRQLRYETFNSSEP